MKSLNREEIAKLAAYIARQDKVTWDEQLEEDFSPDGKHAGVWQKIDAIDAGNFTRCREVARASFFLGMTP